jgi:hypothetical protein
MPSAASVGGRIEEFLLCLQGMGYGPWSRVKTYLRLLKLNIFNNIVPILNVIKFYFNLLNSLLN